MIGRARRRAAPVLAVLAGILLLAAGCSDDDPPTTVGGTDRSATTTAGPTTGFSTPAGIDLDDTTTLTTPATTAPPRVLPPTVVVSGNGIGELALGTPQVDVLAMLVPLLGEPAVQPTECPGGSDASARFPDGLTVHFGGGVLTGWVLTGTPDADGPPVETERGITLGDTVADLQAAHDEGFQWLDDSTLGIEFYIGNGFPYLGGLASGQEPGATVEALWGGDTCAAR